MELKVKHHLLIITFAFLMMVVNIGLGQDSTFNKEYISEGISLNFGYAHYAVKDYYISKEKYSGALPSLKVGWATLHEKYLYRLDFNFANSEKIHNNNVYANIYLVNFNQGFLYPLNRMKLLKKDLYLWIGPVTDFFIYYNKPDIAVSGFDYSQSTNVLLSAAIRTDFFYPINQKIILESGLKFSLLSFGVGMVDMEEDDESMAKLLTLFSGVNLSYDLGMRYNLSNIFSIKFNYKFGLTHISAWEKFISASDNIIIGLTLKI